MREVVVEQEAALDLALLDIIHKLLVFFSTERGGYNRLGFTASEKSRAVNAWQPADFAADRAYFREPATIGAAAAIKDIVAENGFLQIVEHLLGHLPFFGY